MKLPLFLLATLKVITNCPAAEVAQDRYVLENNSLARSFSIKDGKLQTVQIVNKLSGTTIVPSTAPEFRLRLSQGTDKPQTAVTLTSSNFRVLSADSHGTH